jgi:hypothetical protein
MTNIYERVNAQLVEEHIPAVPYDVFSWRMARGIQNRTGKSFSSLALTRTKQGSQQQIARPRQKPMTPTRLARDVLVLGLQRDAWMDQGMMSYRRGKRRNNACRSPIYSLPFWTDTAKDKGIERWLGKSVSII